VAPDDVDQIRGRVETALTGADVVITIGGCSMGEKDLVGDAIDSVGKPGLIFHGIKIKPGRVSGFGVAMNKPIVMLPGFIHSTIVGFEFLVLPLLQQMRRLPLEGAWNIVTARLAEKIHFRSFIPFRNATFMKLKREPDGLMAYPILGDSSSFGIVSKADGIVVAEENRTSCIED
jgi:molybdopterin molybdotransferase